MENFRITFTCNEGELEIAVYTDHIFQAKDKRSAWEIARNLEGEISKCFIPYYDNHKEDFFFHIPENEYFKKAFIKKFETYDSSLDKYIEHTKGKFINVIHEHYKTYLSINDVLTFETIAYGIEQIEDFPLIIPDWLNEIPTWWNGLDQDYFEYLEQLNEDEKEESKKKFKGLDNDERCDLCTRTEEEFDKRFFGEAYGTFYLNICDTCLEKENYQVEIEK